MIPTPPSPEAALCTAYREQVTCYRQAVALAESLPALLRGGGEAHADCLGRVMAHLAEVAALEERIRPLKTQWASAGARPGQALQAILAEAMQLLERLGRSLAAAEEAAAARQAQLGPQVETMVRGREMRRAYRFA